MQENKVADAIHQLNDFVKKKPDSLKAWKLLGICYEKLKRYAEAAGYFGKALEIGPTDFFSCREKARCLFMSGQFEESAKFLEKAAGLAEKKNEKVELLVEKGVAHALLGDGNAAKAFSQAYEIDPKLTADDMQRFFEKISEKANITLEKKLSIQKSINRIRSGSAPVK